MTTEGREGGHGTKLVGALSSKAVGGRTEHRARKKGGSLVDRHAQMSRLPCILPRNRNRKRNPQLTPHGLHSTTANKEFRRLDKSCFFLVEHTNDVFVF